MAALSLSSPRGNRERSFDPGHGFRDERPRAKSLALPPRFQRMLDLKQKSLLRANLIVVVSFLVALVMSDFPHNRPTLLLVLPALFSFAGTLDTARNMRRVYSWYHGGVILCIYMDLMAMAMIVFFLVYPYSHFLTSSR